MHFRSIFLCGALIFLANLLTRPVFAGNGGPDSYGYTWIDSDSSAFSFAWVDIVGRPGAVQVEGMGDDNVSGLIPIGFPFRYYWSDYTQLRIGSNGWLSLGTGLAGNAHCFQSMPSATAQSSNTTLAPFLTDLSFNSSYVTFPNVGEVWHWTSPGLDSFVVTFLNVPWWRDDNFSLNPPDWIGANTFQVILDASDSSITYQYLHLDGDSMPSYVPCTNDLVIGLENSTGQIGLTVSTESVPHDSFAIRFFYPGQDTFEVRDAGGLWNLAPGSKAIFARPGDSIWLRTAVRNFGNVGMDSALHLDSKVLSLGQNLRWSEKDTLWGLQDGLDTVIQFQTPCILQAPGQYFFNTLLACNEDFNPNNDLISSEIVVIDTATPEPILCYAVGNTTETSVSWPPGIGGDYGAAVYMRPPWPIYRIIAIEVFVVGNDGNPNTPLPAGFRVEVFGEDSLGQASELRSSNLITPSQAVEDGWNFVIPPNAPGFQAQGFFVAWIQGGPGIGLGTETAGPKSRQTYEIIGGQWAPYRAINTEEFLVKVHIEPLLVGLPPAHERPRLQALIFPNPASSRAQVQWLHPGGWAHICVRDLYGRVHMDTRMTQLQAGIQRREISVENAADGVYFIEINTKEASAVQILNIKR